MSICLTVIADNTPLPFLDYLRKFMVQTAVVVLVVAAGLVIAGLARIILSLT